MRFKSNMLRFVHRSFLPYWQKTRRANFHRTLLCPTSDYQARSPWTETGGNHLVRDAAYTVDAKESRLLFPMVSSRYSSMLVYIYKNWDIEKEDEFQKL